MRVFTMYTELDLSLMGLLRHINQQQTKITLFRLHLLTYYSTATDKNNILAS